MEAEDTGFIEDIEKKVEYTIEKFRLFSKGEKVGVAVSGGKDSTVCLYILNKLGYEVMAAVNGIEALEILQILRQQR